MAQVSKRRVRVVLLCEDEQQQVFARRFLLKRGFEQRDFHVNKCPKASQSGEAFVRNQYPIELGELRKLRDRGREARLAVIIDADRETVVARQRELDKACKRHGIAPRSPEERVAIFVPKRNIETWVHWIAGKNVDEATPYAKFQRPGDCAGDVKRFAEESRQGLPENAPSSLHDACDELARIL